MTAVPAGEPLYVPPVRGVDADEEAPFALQATSLERTRAAIALALTGLLIATVLLAFFWLDGSSWKNAKELLQIVVPVEVSLLGSALGFYFGSQTQSPG
jgi:hypothetical protein